MRVSYINKTNHHLVRLIDGFKHCGVHVQKHEVGQQYDLVFVDPSADIVEIPKADRIMFFDCEDDPCYFNPGAAYHQLKDKVVAYAKMVYVPDDRRDGIPNIAFPISNYMALQRLADVDLRAWNIKLDRRPMMVVTPTWLTHYSHPKHVKMMEDKNTEGLTPLTYQEDPDGSQRLIYNQRFDWLHSLVKWKQPFTGGIVFREEVDCYTTAKMQEIFGHRVAEFSHSPLNYSDHLHGLMKHELCLCPTGHDRISWRTFDIMAIGNILVWTDVGQRKMLYMPEVYLHVEDEDDLGAVISGMSDNDRSSLLDASKENRKVLAGLSPDKVLKDFLDQVE